MDFMHCTCCQTLVQVNPTGTCLGCQRGFVGKQEDAWKPEDNVPEPVSLLTKVCEDKSDAVEKRQQESDPEEKKGATFSAKRGRKAKKNT